MLRVILLDPLAIDIEYDDTQLSVSLLMDLCQLEESGGIVLMDLCQAEDRES